MHNRNVKNEIQYYIWLGQILGQQTDDQYLLPLSTAE